MAWFLDRGHWFLAGIFTTTGFAMIVGSYAADDDSWWESLLLELGVSFLFVGLIDFVVQVAQARAQQRDRAGESDHG